MAKRILWSPRGALVLDKQRWDMYTETTKGAGLKRLVLYQIGQRNDRSRWGTLRWPFLLFTLCETERTTCIGKLMQVVLFCVYSINFALHTRKCVVILCPKTQRHIFDAQNVSEKHWVAKLRFAVKNRTIGRFGENQQISGGYPRKNDSAGTGAGNAMG